MRLVRPSFLRVVCAFLVAAVGAVVHAGTAPAAETLSIPLLFESNRGQFDAGVDFLSRGPGYAVALTGTQASFSVDVDGKIREVSMRVVNRCQDSGLRGEDAASAVTNYFRGSDPKKWITNVGTFRKVRYDDVYDGVDLVFHGTNRQLEYDFEVAPGVLPDVIAVDFDGMDELTVTPSGDLLLTVGGRELRQARPIAYQTNADGTRTHVAAAFTRLDEQRIGFELGDYDPTRTLVIDPVITFATTVGIRYLTGVRVDAAGFIYVVGLTGEYHIPAAVNGTLSRGSDINTQDVAAMKLTPNANDVVWATYLGGFGDDLPYGLELGPGNELYFAGLGTDEYPVTPGAFSTRPEAPAFVTKLSGDGATLIYSSKVPAAGSSNDPFFWTVDSAGRFVLAGEMGGIQFQTTRDREPSPKLTANGDAYVMRLNATGTALEFSTNFGGRGSEEASGVVVDAQDNIYVAGLTTSLDFPVLNAAQPEYMSLGFSDDTFLTKFNADGTMAFSTFWGGSNDEAVWELVRAPNNEIVMFGYTSSTDFPQVGTQNEITPQGRPFQTIFGTDGSVLLSRFFGEYPITRVAFNAAGQMYAGDFGGSALYATARATTPLWEYPDHISGVSDVTAFQGNFYWVGNADFLHTQPLPLTVTTGIPPNEHAHDKLVKVEAAIPITTFPPRIRSIWPEGGRTAGNRAFFLRTIGFTAKKVYFGDTAVDVNSSGEGNYPPRGPGRIPIQAEDEDGNRYTLQNAFTYTTTLSLNTVTPNRILHPYDQEIVITGTGFIPGAIVSFTNEAGSIGTEAANVRVVNENTIIARTVRMAAGTYGIRVLNPHYYFFSPEPAFVVLKPSAITFAAPSIFNLNPDVYLQQLENGAVTVSGSGLNAGVQVQFDGVLAEFISFTVENGSDRLKVRAPARSTPGLVDVTILSGGDTITLRRAFRYPGPTPFVREVRPASGPPAGGTVVTLVGSGFSPDDTIQFGNVLAPQKTFIDQFTWLVTAPPHHPEATLITVANQHGGGTGNTHQTVYTYTGPFLREIQPTFGTINGGDTIELEGAGFHADAVIRFGGVVAAKAGFPDKFGSYYVTTPPHAAGFVDVEVVNPDGSRGLIPKGYLYRGDGPTLSSISPNIGRTGTETFVTVLGTNFAPRARVDVGGASLRNQTVVDSTTITGTVPGLSEPRAYNVTITNPDGQTATLTGAFTMKGGPKIDGVTPAAGPATGGTTVTINGQGFEPGVQVRFGNDPAASVTWVSATQVTAVTPAHAAGDVDVVMTNPENFSGTRSNGYRFLPPPPTITGFTPALAAPGEAVVITGTDFQFVSDVKFNNIVAQFTVDSLTQITATVPGGSATGNITVTTQSGTATSAGVFTVDNTEPTVTGFTPTSGTGGTSVTITGTRFTNVNAVTFGGVGATFTVNSSTQIAAMAPANGKSGPVCVTTPGPLTGCSAASFSFPPRVSTFSPPEGPAGTNVTIGGANFTGATSVKFNGVAATPFTVSPDGTQITTTVPGGTSTGPVAVTTPLGTGTSSIPFGIPPVIIGFTPERGGVGSGVTITGTGFTHVSFVKFNGAPATFTVVNDTTINATVPAAVTDGPISVTTSPGGTATSIDSFTLALTPVITAFTPSAGAPGTAVTISGNNFAGSTEVRFNGVAALFNRNGNVITATVPNSATNGPISIVNAEGNGVSAALFYLPPVLSSFAPNAGTVGSIVEITGNNFIGATGVSIGNTPAAFAVHAQNKITATIPAGAATGRVTVVTPYGPVSSTFNYTVLSPTTPTVVATAIAPGSVGLSWAGDPTHTYEVRRILRKSDNFTAGALIRLTGNSFVDNSVEAGKTYLYNILDVSTGLIGNHDFATTIAFTDPVVSTGVVVRRSHMLELRAAVNAMRVAASLAPATWTDAVPTVIRAVHVNELRIALAQAYFSLSRSVNFTDDPVPAGMAMRTSHVTELREAVK